MFGRLRSQDTYLGWVFLQQGLEFDRALSTGIKARRSIKERLESFMDRLAVWQLTSSLNNNLASSQGEGSSQGKAKSDRHWTQAFSEDVVDKL